MAQKNQNLRDYVSSLKTPAIGFHRRIRERIGVSIVTVDRWCKLDSTTENPTYLQVLSEETGIAIEDLFKRN